MKSPIHHHQIAILVAVSLPFFTPASAAPVHLVPKQPSPATVRALIAAPAADVRNTRRIVIDEKPIPTATLCHPPSSRPLTGACPV